MDVSLFTLVQDWIKVEHLVIALPQKPLCGNDKRAIEVSESTTKIVGGYYEKSFFWKQGVFLPKNKWLTIKHLDQTDHKLSKNPLIREK